jgi:hypothetical protein
LNGDGCADLAVGAWFGKGYAPTSGTVSIFFGGREPRTNPGLVLKGEYRYGEFGSNLAGVGDVNGDGLPDLAVSAPRADLPESDCGTVYVYFGGRLMDEVADARIPGREIYGGLGDGLSGLGDIDRDGLSDLIIGAPAAFGSANSAGRAMVYSFSRFVFTRPRPEEACRAGDPVLVAWEGAEIADLQYSADDGKSWATVAHGVGGSPQNQKSWTAPETPCEHARLRLSPAAPGVSGVAESPGFAIRSR